MLTRARLALRSPDGARRAADYALAVVLFRLSPDTRRAIFAGDDHECSLCGARLSRFLQLHRPCFRWCPVCRSLQRHRFSWLLLQRQLFSTRLPGDVLHFAPEESLANAFRRLPHIRYATTDLYAPGVTLRADIVRLPHRDAVFDLIYCSHVLEHIPDDRAAMRELRRVLRVGGIAVILTPLWTRPTFEDPGVTDPFERERLFGQHDHVRWYGLDIVERLSGAGFSVCTVRAGDIANAAEIERYGLDVGEVAFLCSAH